MKDDYATVYEEEDEEAEDDLLVSEEDTTLKHFVYAPDSMTVSYDNDNEALESVRLKIKQDGPTTLTLDTQDWKDEDASAIAKILASWVGTAKEKDSLVFIDKGNPENSFEFGITKGGKTTYHPMANAIVAAHVRSQYSIPSSVQSFSVGDGKSESGWKKNKEINIKGKTTDTSKDQDFTLKIDPPEAYKDNTFMIDTTGWHRNTVVIQLADGVDITNLTFKQGNGEGGTRGQVYKFIDKDGNPFNLNDDQINHLQNTCKINFETVFTPRSLFFFRRKDQKKIINGRENSN